MLFIITPTVLAGVYVHQANKEKPTDWFTVLLYDSDGQLLVQAEGDPSNASVKTPLGMFYAIATASEKPTYPIGDPDTDPYVRAEMTLNGVAIERTCYFSFRDVDSYCIDSDGTVYAISETVSKNFLSSAYAEAFYDTATPPVLSTLDNEAVLPSSAMWHYKNRSDADMQANWIPTTDQEILYEITGELGISFSKAPGVCQVQVYDSNGDGIFRGSHQELSKLTTAVGDILTVHVQASWNAETFPDAYGSLEYRFSVKIRNQSTFSLSESEVSPGGLLILSCTNITTLSKISFTVDRADVIPTPTFHRDGDYARALLAIPEQAEAQTLQLTVSYGASKQAFTVTVREKPTAPRYDFPTVDRTESTERLPEAMIEWERILQTLPDTSDTFPYFQGNFSDPTQNGFSLSYTHGGIVFYGSDLSESFSAIGTEFRADSADDLGVRVLHHGRVLQIGTCELLGNYVVVDHGCGLRTWYGHLSSISVEVGNVVKQGDRIGQCGSGGLAVANGFLVLCTVGDTIVDPAAILGKEIPLSRQIAEQ